jgi:lipopolysaccharide/colanic/teichoic acid biosynthesis glycosyltransferase
VKIKKKKKSIVIKRIIDVIVSGIGLIILLPIFVITGILIKLDSKGPVFFVQERVGLLEGKKYPKTIRGLPE